MVDFNTDLYSLLYTENILKFGEIHWILLKSYYELESRMFIPLNGIKVINLSKVQSTKPFFYEIYSNEINWWFFRKIEKIFPIIPNSFKEFQKFNDFSDNTYKVKKKCQSLLNNFYDFIDKLDYKKFHSIDDGFSYYFKELRTFFDKEEDNISFLMRYVSNLNEDDILSPIILFSQQIWSHSLRSERIIRIRNTEFVKNTQESNNCALLVIGVMNGNTFEINDAIINIGEDLFDLDIDPTRSSAKFKNIVINRIIKVGINNIFINFVNYFEKIIESINYIIELIAFSWKLLRLFELTGEYNKLFPSIKKLRQEDVQNLLLDLENFKDLQLITFGPPEKEISADILEEIKNTVRKYFREIPETQYINYLEKNEIDIVCDYFIVEKMDDHQKEKKLEQIEFFLDITLNQFDHPIIKKYIKSFKKKKTFFISLKNQELREIMIQIITLIPRKVFIDTIVQFSSELSKEDKVVFNENLKLVPEIYKKIIDKKELRILHFSDLHFKPINKEDETASSSFKSIFDGILNELENLNDKWKPNIVVISGDITFKGYNKGYNLAQVWIDRLINILSLKSNNLIICPGNHDLNRNTLFISTLRPVSYRDVDRLLRIEYLEDISVPFKDFIKFSSGLKILRSKIGPKTSYLIGYRKIKDINFLIFNSAWFSKNEDVYGSDHGNLYLGLNLIRQLRNQFSPNKNHLIISIFHHPIDWISDFEKYRIDSSIEPALINLGRISNIWLNGHIHENRPSIPYSRFGSIQLTVGSSNLGDRYPNNFAIYKINSVRDKLERKVFIYNPNPPAEQKRYWDNEIDVVIELHSNKIIQIKKDSFLKNKGLADI